MNQALVQMEAANVACAERIRMVVVSDIHATESGDPITNVAKSTATKTAENALTGACSFLPEVAADTDCILCPGDLVHEGRTHPMKWVWEELHKLSQALDAPLIGTAGNHDMVLKPKGALRPNSALRLLDPKFPYTEQTCIDTFWAHDFAIVAEGDWRVLAINSSAQLGFFDESEADHGRFGRDCLRELPERLDQIGTDKAINVCMVHHHPQEWTEDSDDPSSHMLEGDRLIKLLEHRSEHWMLIHGHMHHPRLDYIGHGSAGPARLASGSVGANLLVESGVQFSNQLHVVDFDLGARQIGLAMAGLVTSYDWEEGQGWREPTEGSGLAHVAPFGYRRDGFELAAALRKRAQEIDRRMWSWAEVLDWEPRARFLIEADRLAFYAGVRRLGGGVQEGVEQVSFEW